MKAFHGKASVKTKYLNRVKAHILADEVIKGKYWENGKGCAVGCTIHSAQHESYETELGIPEWLARVEDTIFEGLPDREAKLWPKNFLSTIKPGVDLDKVKAPFIVFVLESVLDTFDHSDHPKSKQSIDSVILLWKRKDIGSVDWEKYRADAASASDYAAYAASAAAYAYASAASASASASAAAYASASAAAYAASAYAARSAAAYAARSAAASAVHAAHAAHAAYAARQKTYSKFAKKLLKLIKELK